MSVAPITPGPLALPSSTSRPSFGVEFEFSIACLNPLYQQDPNDRRQVTELKTRQPFHPPFPAADDVYDIDQVEFLPEEFLRLTIAHKLQEAGLPAVACIDNARPTYYGNTPRQSKWFVQADSSVVPPFLFGQMYKFSAIEINSPAYIFGEEALAAVRTAVELLTSTYLINSGRSAGLHVHLGYGSHGIPLPVMKDLMSFLWAFEPVQDYLHPPHRHDNFYSEPLRKCAEVNVKHQARYGEQTQISSEAAIREIQACTTMLELVHTAENVEVYPAYRFLQMAATTGTFKRTIEMRQHRATLNAEACLNWIEMLVSILSLVRQTTGTEWLKSLISRQLNGGTALTIIQLLNLVGLEKQARYYEAHPGSSFGENGQPRKP